MKKSFKNKNYMIHKTRIIAMAGLFVIVLILFNSCVNVKPYQKMYINDYEMKLAGKKSDVFDNGIESYREGAAGATGGKTGGGCGCN